MKMPSSSPSSRFSQFVARHLVVPKMLNFTMNLVFYCCYTFRPKYLKVTQNVSTKDYGILAAVFSLVLFLSGYIWSALADRIGNAKSILIVSCLSSAAVFQLFLFKFPYDLRIPLSALVSGLYIFFVGALVPLTDTIVINILNTTPGASKELYGRQRLFGSLGYALVSVVVSYTQIYPTVNFLVIGFSILFALFVFFFLEVPQKPHSRAAPRPISKVSSCCSKEVPVIRQRQSLYIDNNNTGISCLLSNMNFVFLLAVVFMNGLAKAVMTHFQEPIQRTLYDMPQWASGFSCFTGVILEIVSFLYSKELLNNIGVRRMLLISQIAMAARIGCYAFIPRGFLGSRFMPLVYELLRGLSFGLMQTAGVVYVSDIAPRNLKTTAQALYTGVYTGVAAFVAGLVGYVAQSGIKHQFPLDDPRATQIEAQQSLHMLQWTFYASVAAFVLFFVKYIVYEEWIVERRRLRQIIFSLKQ